MNRVAITGATSMLGLALVEDFVAAGVKVLAFVRGASARRALLPQSPLVEVIECDLDGYGSLILPAWDKCDVFYHFAWEATQNANRNDTDAQQRNIAYALDALKLARRLGCRRFIGAGSQAEYGRVNGSIDETMRPSPDSAYGVAKYAAGKLTAIEAERLGIRHIWARIFSTYGPGDMPSTMIMYCINTLLQGEEPMLTPGDQQWDYLYCKDASRAFYLLGAKDEAHGVYNIGSGNAQALKEYITTLRNAIDPALPLGFGRRPYAEKQVMHLCADTGRLRRDTGFVPRTPFEIGIRKTIAWARDHKEAQP